MIALRGMYGAMPMRMVVQNLLLQVLVPVRMDLESPVVGECSFHVPTGTGAVVVSHTMYSRTSFRPCALLRSTTQPPDVTRPRNRGESI